MNPLHRYCLASMAYGAIHNLVYVPKLKENEYMTDVVVKFCMCTAAAPILAPTFLYCDFKNLEHKLRKMPGSIDRRPW
jgi:hypothetical protein